MSDLASPKVPPYRMTLFYGPERDESDSHVMYCVFNVKKRSWKGGVQVAVEMSQSQMGRIHKRFDFDQWLQASVVHLPESEQEDCLDRGQDIFVQQVCLVKLQLAIEVGIKQENSRVPKDFLMSELDEELGKEEEMVKGEILQELDIELPA